MSSIRGSRPVPEPRRAAGFTLVEVLVALVIGGIVATAILQLMQGNGRFVAMQAAREEVQQNGRAAIDLIAADLRGLPPSAIRRMEANAIGFHLPRAWGILCGALGAGATTAYVLFPADAFPEAFQENAPHWGVAVDQTPDPATGSGRYLHVPRAQRVPAGTRCDAVQPDAADGGRYYTTGLSVGSPLVDPAALGPSGTIEPGTQVMVYEEVAYDVASSGATPGLWIRRMSGYAASTRNMQPMAGPLPADTSLVFRYLREDGVSPASVAAEVRSVRIWLEVQSRAHRREGNGVRPEQVDTVTTDVILRNR